jgi:hypothetical protein
MTASIVNRFGNRMALAISAFLLLNGVAAPACDIPVFRYGLERWSTEPHVISFSPTSPVDLASIKLSPHANIRIQRNPSAQNQEVQVNYVNSESSWYEGPWETNLLDRLTDSPMRRLIAHDLLTGSSAVWILIESDNPATNAIAEKIAREVLEEFSKDTVLTKQLDTQHEEMEENKLYTTIPLHVAFTLHTVSRKNPGETFLIRQIEGAYPDPVSPAAPILVAIFGQGRMIHIPQDMLTPVFIKDLCQFLCGDCSCQIKELNPGLDLAMTVNWEEATRNYPAPAPTVLADGNSFVVGGTGAVNKAMFLPPAPPPAPATTTPPAQKTAPPKCTSGSSSCRIISVSALIAIVLLGWLMLAKKK